MTGSENKEKRMKISEGYMKKKEVLEKYIKSAPFTRTKDKVTFIFGVLLVIFTSFIMGRFPHTYYYDYHCIL